MVGVGHLATWEGWCADHGGGGGASSSGVGESATAVASLLVDGGGANSTASHQHVVVAPGVLGGCFQDLVVYSGAALVVALHASVLVVQLSLKARRASKRRASKPLFVWRGEWLRNLELLACVACIAAPIVQIIALNRQHAAWILFTALNGVCWLLYASVLEQYPEKQLRNCHYRPPQRGVTRAPWSLRLSGLLLTGAGAYRLFTLLKMGADLRAAHTIGELTQLGTFFLHALLVLISLCVPMRPRFLRHTFAVPRSATTSIQGAGDEEEEGEWEQDQEFTPLLAHTLPTEDGQVFQYGSVDRVAADPSVKAPETGASLLSKLVFQWADPLLHFGYLCNMLRSGDLFALPKDLNTEQLCDTFSTHVFALRETHGDKHFVLRAFNRCYGWRYYPLAILKILADAAGFAGPLLLHELVQLIDEKNPNYNKGYLYAGLLCASTAFGSFCNTHYTFQVNKTQVAVRAAVTSSVFRKALRSRVGEKANDKQESGTASDDTKKTAANGSGVETGKQSADGVASGSSKEKDDDDDDDKDKKRSLSTVGGVLNLMSTDADRLANFCPSFHQFWSLPFQIAVSLYLLYRQVGLSFLAGLFFALVMIPLNRAVAKRIGALGKDLMHNKDERVKLTGEVVSAIRVVRMYAWERLFEKRINAIRERELKALRGRKYLDAVCVYLWATTPVLISISTFATYSLLGNQLTAATVFTSMALFNILIGPLNAFPWVLNGLVEAWVSLDRVESYLRLRYTFASAQQAATAAAATAAATSSSNTQGAAAAARPSSSTLRTSPAASTSSSWAFNSAQQPASVAAPGFTSPTPIDAASAVALPAAAGDLALAVEHGYFAWQDAAANSHGLSSRGGGGGSTSSGSMEWSGRGRRGDSSSMCLLRDVSLSLGRTEWLCVTGEVGSGKTMLLLGILGELAPVRGSVRVSAAIAKRGVGYVPQEPWILNATIRENILCGRPMYRRLYDQVLHACALLEDLRDIRGGDMAELGENGINLSGGQKARIGLARAAYQQLPLYLLDSPLAALDRPTAHHVLQHCVCGVMSGSARVLVTENPDAIAAAPRVLRLAEGGLVDVQSPKQSASATGNTVACGAADGPGEEGVGLAAAHSADEEQGLARAGVDTEEGNVGEKGDSAELALSRGSSNDDSCTGPRGGWARGSVQKQKQGQGQGQGQDQNQGREQLLSEEDRVVGTVRAAVYATYLRAIGVVLAAAVLVALTLMQGSRNVSDWWLSNWVTHADANSSADARQYLEIYGFISAGNTVFTLLRAFLFAYAGVVAARVIHRRLLHSVFSARIDFFDRNPAGRIVNRFSSDINSVDDSLPFIANILLAQLFGLVGTVAVMCYSQPYFLFLLVPLGAVYYRIQRYYRQTSREVKRLGNIARSPIYAHFSESLTGVVSVRAMHMVRQFELENVARMDANQVASYNEQVVSQWLGVRLQVLGVAMLTGVAFLAAAQHHSGGANPGLAGLAISYALSVTGVLQGLVTSFTETEKEMVCVERCDAFIHAEQEEDDSDIASALAAEATDPDVASSIEDGHVEASPGGDLGGHTLDGDGAINGRRRGWRRRSTRVGVGPLWPQYGEVLFRDVTVRYRADLPPALRNFTLSVRAGEKLGICGRTGSGKSTLFRALLRMVDYSGSIVIDGVDIALVRRARLRRSVAVIPQDPVMFSGTVRSNLDPFDQHSTAELLEVLDKCCLRGRVGSLSAEVEEQGRNLSSGEKQLVCLGRALLRGCRVLCIDEATANVDARTDALVQRTIQENFEACTVMTIAHRTNTLAHCNRVIHIGRGRLEEVEDRRERAEQGLRDTQQ